MVFACLFCLLLLSTVGNLLEGLLETLIRTHSGNLNPSVEAASQVLPEELDGQQYSPTKAKASVGIVTLIS